MRRAAGLAAAAAWLLAGCGHFGGGPRGGTLEAFDATDRFSRLVSAPPAQACEAARLALLSQGYQVSVLKADELRGRKNFQPQADRHAQVEVHVVCATAVGGPDQGEVFVNAVQDRYELKKSSNAASIGVPAIASLSLPFSLGNDAMVKTASETITAERFYDRFFEVLERYLGSATRLPSEEMAGTPAVPR
jgi:hypothetical protein